MCAFFPPLFSLNGTLPADTPITWTSLNLCVKSLIPQVFDVFRSRQGGKSHDFPHEFEPNGAQILECLSRH